MSLSRPFGLLVEGYDESTVPAVAFVRQGDKAFFFRGKPDALLVESLDTKVQVLESFDKLELSEGKNGERYVKDGRWFVEGVFQRSDVKNANKRTYRLSLWKKLIENQKSPVIESLKARGMLGHLEHPKDGRTDLKESGLLVESLKLQQDGVVWGRAELLETPNGKILQELTRKNVRWGVSSRGSGSVDDNGFVNDDFMVETWDAVARPSTPGAYPTINKEQKEGIDEATVIIPTELSEEANELVETALIASGKEFEGLDNGGKKALQSELIRLLNRTTELASANEMPPSVALDVSGWLSKRLNEMDEAGAVDLDAHLDSALNNLTESESERQAAIASVTASLEQRVTDAVNESGTLRDTLTETEASLATRGEELTAKQAELDEAKAALAAVRQQLSIASETIAHLSSAEKTDPVNEEVEAVLKECPRFERHKDELRKCKTPTAVRELAESLLPTLLETPVVVSRSKSGSPGPRRASLPVSMIVESENVAAVTATRTPIHEGAASAAAALRKMQPV